MFIEKYNRYFNEIAENLASEIPGETDATIILGSGMSSCINDFETINTIPYNNIRNFPKPTVDGHSGECIVKKIKGRYILFFSGRFHFYEGKPIEELLLQTAISKLLKIDNICFTNAAGGLNFHFENGDLMIVEDILNFINYNFCNIFSDNFIENNISSQIFCNDRLKGALNSKNLRYRTGILATVKGPCYETPAEIRFYRKTGADALGMSVAVESAFAKLLGLNVSCCSVITNLLNENNPSKLNHDEVIESAKKAEKLLNIFIESYTELLS